MNTFNLLHVALYAKGWYERFSKGNTIFDDLRKCLTMDGYCGELMDNRDVYMIILSNCQRINQRHFTDLVSVIGGISEQECWKIGYYVKSNSSAQEKCAEELPEYDLMTATIYYCLSGLQFLNPTKELGLETVPKPDFKKCLPRKKGITQKRVNEMFK